VCFKTHPKNRFMNSRNENYWLRKKNGYVICNIKRSSEIIWVKWTTQGFG
jgi:hypothetical protein